MSGSTSNSFAQDVANYISQNVSGPVASITTEAATYGSQLVASYISTGAQNLENFLGSLGSSSSTSSSSSSSSSLSNLIQEGLSQFAPQLSSSSSSALSSLISTGIQDNLPTGVSLNGSTLSLPTISTPFGSFNASFQNGALSVTPSSSS